MKTHHTKLRSYEDTHREAARRYVNNDTVQPVDAGDAIIAEGNGATVRFRVDSLGRCYRQSSYTYGGKED